MLSSPGSSMDVSRGRPRNEVAFMTCHSKTCFRKTWMIREEK